LQGQKWGRQSSAQNFLRGRQTLAELYGPRQDFLELFGNISAIVSNTNEIEIWIADKEKAEEGTF
jgi:hypothetical protein